MAVKPRLEVPEHAQQRAAALVGRTWVLDRINRWLDEDSKPFLLLVANPGWGKTALSAWLAGAGPEPEHANEATALAGLRAGWDAAHFCVARRRAGSVDPNLFAQRLAEQLAVRIDGFGEAAMARIAPNVQADVTVRENWGTVVGVNIERLIVNAPDAQTVYGEAVRKPLEALERSAPGVEVRILVDALDEAVRDAGTDIVELVAGSVDLPAGVRWVLTTRNERRVLDQFGAEDAEKIYLGDEFAVDAKRDLRAYVAERLATDARLTLAAPRAAELESKLAEHASDNFLYAEWVLKEIAERKREPSDVERLPQGLYGLYREFLDRLLPKDPQRFEEAWLGTHMPLLGCLAVATPAAPAETLPDWLEWSRARLNVHVDEILQLIESVSEAPEGRGYRLYHRSIAEFLGAGSYEEEGRERDNRYHVKPQHDRIAAHYLGRIANEWGGDWTRSDTYGLRQLVGHLRARLDPGQDGATRRALYDVALDQRFHAAQSERLGIHSTLSDLRATLETALASGRSGDLVSALRCVAAFRAIVRGEGLSQAVFGAVESGDVALALTKTTHYGVEARTAGGWSAVLRVYLAWEAAEDGHVDIARQVVADTAVLRWPVTSELTDALLTRTAAALACVQGDERGWLADFGVTDPDSLVARYAMPSSPGDAAVRAIAEQVRPHVDRLVMASEAGEADAVSSRAFAESSRELALERRERDLQDPESRAELTWSLQGRLRDIADSAVGQELITRAVTPMLQNPYPRYRDIGLVALGVAVLGSPDRQWARRRLQAILRAGLDDEGVTFTFDLAAVVGETCRRRNRSAPRLDAYLSTAKGCHDVWGTGLRALSALAAASQDRQQGPSWLRQASGAPTTYAGYGVTAVLGLIDRCHELGDPDLAAAATWGPGRDMSLQQMAAGNAERVYDPKFRDERHELVLRHGGWEQEPAPDAAGVQKALADMRDADVRGAYLNHISARYAALPEPKRSVGLKALVPLALFDSTTLDAILGRLMAACADDVTDDELGTIADLTEHELTTGRPWTLGEWR